MTISTEKIYSEEDEFCMNLANLVTEYDHKNWWVSKIEDVIYCSFSFPHPDSFKHKTPVYVSVKVIITPNGVEVEDDYGANHLSNQLELFEILKRYQEDEPKN